MFAFENESHLKSGMGHTIGPKYALATAMTRRPFFYYSIDRLPCDIRILL